MSGKKDTQKKSKDAPTQEHDKVAELEAQVAELNDALLRERADAENVRKRAEEEKLQMGGFYKSLVVKELLSTVDNFDRALSSLQTTKDDEAGNKEFTDLKKGFEAIYKQFEAALSKLGVEKIKTVGEHFDPNLHEAVTMEEGDGEHEIVSEELQAGYKIEQEVLRHAMVRVKS